MRLALVVAVSALAGCATPRATPVRAAAPAGVMPAGAAAGELAAATANFVVLAEEVVSGPEREGISATRVFVDGALAGQTPNGLRSAAKRWEGVVESGNRLVRCERWILPGTGDWVRGPESGQPRERFFRVEPGTRTVVNIRYFDEGNRYSYDVSREPLPPPPPGIGTPAPGRTP